MGVGVGVGLDFFCADTVCTAKSKITKIAKNKDVTLFINPLLGSKIYHLVESLCLNRTIYFRLYQWFSGYNP